MMLRYIYIVLLLLGWGVSTAQIELSTQNPTYKTVQKVYDKICKAAGDYRAELPQLVVMDRVLRVASYRSYDNKLIIEKKAFDICKSLGKDKMESALAFLIGHELTHFYQKHDWGGEGGESGFGTNFLMDHEAFSEHVHHEEEADTYGAFVAYLAGYEVLSIIPEVLEAIYKSYALKDKMMNYPSLKERKAVVSKVEGKIKELIRIYDNANYFAAIGWNMQALSCYNHLLKFVKTKELYNNIAMVYLSVALVQIEDDTPIFEYPIKVDLDYTLRDYSFFQGRSKTLKNAQTYLKKAIELDPNYHTAHLNLACVYDAQSKYDLASLHLARVATPTDLEVAQITMIKGIMAVHQGHKMEAESLFNTITHESLKGLAEQNRRVLKGEENSIQNSYNANSRESSINKLLLEASQLNLDNNIAFEANDFFELSLSHQSLKDNSITLFNVENKLEGHLKKHILYHSNSKSFALSKKVILPTNIKQLIQKPQHYNYRLVQHSKGTFLVSNAQGLILSIDKKNRVEEWAIFGVY
ncbi:MAG: hypothetical protein GY810_17415 [Aureispira sp.]|nr:hypothetical protein [Aureispira sp.]